MRGILISATALTVVTALAACGGGGGVQVPTTPQSVAPTATTPPAKTLACDESMKTNFKPDSVTTVLLVKQYRKGDPLVLAEAVGSTTPVAKQDLCLVKINVGPGVPGPQDAPSTTPGIGIEVWMPLDAATW